MEQNQASIAIFSNQAEYKENLSRPNVPEAVFEAAKRVIESKGCELIKARNGLYVVKYSEHGPFSREMGEEWLPIYVARIEKWNSGGIKKSEMEQRESTDE